MNPLGSNGSCWAKGDSSPRSKPRALPSKVGRYSCYSLPIDPTVLSQYAAALGITESESLPSLARAVSSSPHWSRGPKAVLVAHPCPRPMLILIGDFDEAWEAHVQVHARHLDRACRRLRYVSYRRAQQDCRILASQLLEKFDEAELSSLHFTCIPKEGEFRTGFALLPAQLETGTAAGSPSR